MSAQARIRASSTLADSPACWARANPRTDVHRLRFDVGRPMDHTRHNRNDIRDPNTIARCRELLGDEAEGLSDDEIDQIRRQADTVAHVIVEMFLEQRAA